MDGEEGGREKKRKGGRDGKKDSGLDAEIEKVGKLENRRGTKKQKNKTKLISIYFLILLFFNCLKKILFGINKSNLFLIFF